MTLIEKQYELAKEKYKAYGIDTEEALKQIDNLNISIHCWQGDDVQGLLKSKAAGGGIQVTGNYPGKAHNANELRDDISKVLSLVPGKHRLNLHAIYAESDLPLSLENIQPEHFDQWIKWAQEHQLALDFNPTCFGHPMVKQGLTLSHPDETVRTYWVNHCINARKIGAYFTKKTGIKAVVNLWIPDGFKDFPYARTKTRSQLVKSLDQIYAYQPEYPIIDTLESKLFGLGLEGYTVGSNEFYLGYAIKNDLGICLDLGHFHPTESVSDKISSVSLYVNHILLHVSRPMRWDSDHVVIFDDELQRTAEAVIRDGLLNKVHVGLDYFDASINRIVAWVTGIRNTQKAFLKALLEPKELLKKIENNFDFTARLAWTEELKSLPFGVVYDYYCDLNKKPIGLDYFKVIEAYEKELTKRGEK